LILFFNVTCLIKKLVKKLLIIQVNMHQNNSWIYLLTQKCRKRVKQLKKTLVPTNKKLLPKKQKILLMDQAVEDVAEIECEDVDYSIL